MGSNMRSFDDRSFQLGGYSMNLPLMSPAELDNSVYKLVAEKFGVANAMRFIARHTPSDGIDYTQERQSWLPQELGEVERLLAESDAAFECLVADSHQKPRRQ
jgi:hypothetical protein